ncbi:TMEM175 family protein [Lactobacillus terrae]|uniref:TMEM175 family protein n=1 Tax=Lactobacillus terrae TaxID=2269374 RepID=UPI000C1B6D6F|nr:TMEM175 family protein [Lactobacillus terrae]
MNIDRLTAFEDAVLAIIMTILVLELKEPDVVSVAGFWDLKLNFFAYALSFFWLGLMWMTHHNNWRLLSQVNNNTVVLTLVLLFFSSLFPYTTKIVAENFYNKTAQVFYGVIIIIISFLNIAISRNLGKINPEAGLGLLYTSADRTVYIDLAIKLIGLILALTVFPPAMMISILIASCVISIDSQLAK